MELKLPFRISKYLSLKIQIYYLFLLILIILTIKFPYIMLPQISESVLVNESIQDVLIGLLNLSTNLYSHIWSSNFYNNPYDYTIISGRDTYHYLRLFAVYPSIFLHNYIGISLNISFTFYVIILYFVYLNLISKIIKTFMPQYKFNFQQPVFKFLFIILPILLLPLFGNGRLFLALTGFTMILYIQIFQFSRKIFRLHHLLVFLIGLILTSVSSGTQAVALLQILSFSYYYLTKILDYNKDILFYVYLFLFYILLIFTIPFIWVGLVRNLYFFNWDFEMLLNHGIGKIIYLIWGPCTYLFLLCSILILIIFMLNLINKLRKEYFIVAWSIFLSILGLFMGLLTGLMAIPGLIILLYQVENLRIRNLLK